MGDQSPKTAALMGCWVTQREQSGREGIITRLPFRPWAWGGGQHHHPESVEGHLGSGGKLIIGVQKKFEDFFKKISGQKHVHQRSLPPPPEVGGG